MSDPFFIFLPPDKGDMVVFVGGDGGMDMVRREFLGVAAHAAKGLSVVAVVPGRDILLTQVKPPAGASRRQLTKMVPFLLEEDVLQPVEGVHVVLGRPGERGTLGVGVVARKVMEGWLGVLQRAGIQPRTMVCDTLLLPWELGVWTVFLRDGFAWVRWGEEAGFSVEASSLMEFLSLALKEDGPKPRMIRLMDFSKEPSDLDLTGLSIPIKKQFNRQDMVLAMIQGGWPRPVPNLLQGFARTSGLEAMGLGAVRWTLALLVVWLLIKSGLAMVETRYLREQEGGVQKQITAQLLDVFPQVAVVVSPRAQMTQQLDALKKNRKEGKKGDYFVEWMAKLGMAAKGVEGLVFTRMNYQESGLDLVLECPDLAHLDRLVTTLKEKYQLHARIRKADQVAQGIQGHLRIERP